MALGHAENRMEDGLVPSARLDSYPVSVTRAVGAKSELQLDASRCVTQFFLSLVPFLPGLRVPRTPPKVC
jgi:hypothetical protein